MKAKGIEEDKLVLLKGVSGAFRHPSVLPFMNVYHQNSQIYVSFVSMLEDNMYNT